MEPLVGAAMPHQKGPTTASGSVVDEATQPHIPPELRNAIADSIGVVKLSVKHASW